MIKREFLTKKITMNKQLLICTLVLNTLSNVFAQDVQFVNNPQALVQLNPSFAGSNGFVRNQLTYRNQWANLSLNNITVLNTFDAYIKPLRAGIAISALQDNYARGRLKTTAMSIAYAQHISLLDGNLKVIPSLQASVCNRSLDPKNIGIGDYIDGVRWNNNVQAPVSKTYFDLSSGLLINYKNLYVGGSFSHINQPDHGLLGAYKLPVRSKFHVSYNLHLSEKTLINFSGKYELQDRYSFYQLNANVLLLKHFILGVGYGQNYITVNQLSSIETSKIISGTPNLTFGFKQHYFSAQINYSQQGYYLSSFGIWEASLSFNLRTKELRKELTDFEKW